MEVLDLNMNAGDDTLTTDSGLGAFKIDAEGGDGNDTSTAATPPTCSRAATATTGSCRTTTP